LGYRHLPNTIVSAAAADESWTATHPLSPHDQAVVTGLRAMVEPNKGKLRGIAAREPFDAIIGRTAAPEDVSYQEDRIGGLSGWWCVPAAALPGAAIVHFHGGWFNWGASKAFRHLVGHIARSASVSAFVPDYRLAPENPFPAAVDDAQACLRDLAQRNIRSLAVTGDSAGGNLALTVLPRLAAASSHGGIRPVGAAVLSPVTDLTLSGQTWESLAETDPYFLKDQAESLVDAYLGGHPPTDPVASPLYGDLTGLPPIRVHVGGAEVLLSDSLRYVARAVAAGVDAKVDVWEGMPHGYVGAVGRMEAAGRTLEAIGAFLSAQFDRALAA